MSIHTYFSGLYRPTLATLADSAQVLGQGKSPQKIQEKINNGIKIGSELLQIFLHIKLSKVKSKRFSEIHLAALFLY